MTIKDPPIKISSADKNMRGLLVAAASVALLALGFIFLRNFDALAGWLCGEGIVGIRIPDVTVEVGDRRIRTRAYRSLGNCRFVFLVDAPVSASEQENLLASGKYIARFNDGGGSFMKTPLLVIAGETIRTPYHIDDIVKGWGADYRIDAADGHVGFEIRPAPPEHPNAIRFSIPLKYLRI